MAVVSDLKKMIRGKLINKRKDFNDYIFKQENDIIYQKVMELISCHSSPLHKEQIGLYWPLKAEPDLLKIAIIAKNAVGLPKIRNSEMSFTRYRPEDPIEKSSVPNLYHPVQEIEIVPELIIVPGLGFSIDGYRIGYGYGYYDKYLNKISTSKPITIGVCFHDNLFEYLPFEEHDYQLDYIVTDKIIIKR